MYFRRLKKEAEVLFRIMTLSIKTVCHFPLIHQLFIFNSDTLFYTLVCSPGVHLILYNSPFIKFHNLIYFLRTHYTHTHTHVLNIVSTTAFILTTD